MLVDWLLSAATHLCVAAVVIAVLLMVLARSQRHLQDELLYHPNMPPGSSGECDEPAASGFKPGQSQAVEVTAADGVKVRGYLLRPQSYASGSRASDVVLPLMVYFHGNAGNVGHRLPIARLFVEAAGCQVLMMDYRGYGLSDPTAPTEAGLKLDADAVMEWALDRCPNVDRRAVHIFGTSLGGAVAINWAATAARRKELATVMVENTFLSISDMADALFAPIILKKFPRAGGCLVWFLGRVVKPLLLCIGWYSIDLVRTVECPMLFVIGLKDELVPPAHCKALHDAAKRSAYRQIETFPTAGHNDCPNVSGYAQRIAGFMRTAAGRQNGTV
jgi:pimeloyl-ACP methyl ester carboxylesterase